VIHDDLKMQFIELTYARFVLKAEYHNVFYEGDSISKLQIVIENRMEIMTYKQHLFFNIISMQI